MSVRRRLTEAIARALDRAEDTLASELAKGVSVCLRETGARRLIITVFDRKKVRQYRMDLELISEERTGPER